MSSTSIDLSVQDALDQIIVNEGLEPETQIKVNQGSEAGDGFVAKTYAVTLKAKRRTINLFIKYFPLTNGAIPPIVPVVFDNETTFYGEIYPAILKFQSERNIKDGFCNVPKAYMIGGTRGTKPVVLENIKLRGYDLRNKQERINDDHVVMVLQVIAKLHAVSYAMKDQEPELFEKLSSKTGDMIREIMATGFDNMVGSCIDQFNAHLDDKRDAKFLAHSDGLSENLLDFARNTGGCKDEYSVILHGDCWSNNMMFLYKDDKSKPLDIKLLDWQLMRINSPVFDVSYFFYTIATKDMMSNLDKYLKIYHDALCVSIRKLGSDPNKMLPYDVLKLHWKNYSKFGFLVAFMIIRGMLYDKDEVPDLSFDDPEAQVDVFTKTMKSQDEYQTRIKDIFEHFLNNHFL